YRANNEQNWTHSRHTSVIIRLPAKAADIVIIVGSGFLWIYQLLEQLDKMPSAKESATHAVGADAERGVCRWPSSSSALAGLAALRKPVRRRDGELYTTTSVLNPFDEVRVSRVDDLLSNAEEL